MAVLLLTSLACSRDVALSQAQAHVSIPKVSPFFRLLTCRRGYMSANVKLMSLELVLLLHTKHRVYRGHCGGFSDKKGNPHGDDGGNGVKGRHLGRSVAFSALTDPMERGKRVSIARAGGHAVCRDKLGREWIWRTGQ
ncbi:uncharacterized protein B0T23DRAFT_376745 [Neurospora hispaniola]|uniref:Secreted protein n=1 Tax=Neurospora hispaniola TaxID=588809 RepID=A0AAJ0MS99_9PEZI|nr:hypothetical protein B0T23DRAFT_376745 [Neurospora hispaniola]